MDSPKIVFVHVESGSLLPRRASRKSDELNP